METNKFKINFSGGKVTLSDITDGSNDREKPEETTFRIENITDDLGKIKITTNVSAAYNKFDSFFNYFTDEIIKMGLPQKTTTKIFNLCGDLVNENEQLSCSVIGANIYDVEVKKSVTEHLFTSFKHVKNHIEANNTRHKRDKIQNENIMYVPPVEKSISLKWRTKISSFDVLPNYKLIQSTFQYVPIVATLSSLFSGEEFKNIYFEYNAQKHKCTPGIYEDYCCGSRFSENNLNSYANSIHIQLGIDDVEVCCALKSKATIHKVTAIYFKILNIPHEFSSRLKQIHVVAVCETANIKASEHGIDFIIEQIVDEFKYLHETGINVDGSSLKGFLINVCFDNLGGNELYGIKAHFVSDYFCRMCEMTLEETRKSTHEEKNKLRDVNTYENIMNDINEISNVDFNTSRGFKKHCLLNDIPFFHILENVCVDPMHDLMEGVIKSFLSEFIKFCCKQNYQLTQDKICARIRDFN